MSCERWRWFLRAHTNQRNVNLHQTHTTSKEPAGTRDGLVVTSVQPLHAATMPLYQDSTMLLCCTGSPTSQEMALSTLPGTRVEMLREELDTSSTQGCSLASALHADPQPVTNSLVDRCPAAVVSPFHVAPRLPPEE